MYKTSKYETLLNVLDKISLEAPVTHKFYRPSESDTDYKEKINQARSRSLIHLYLKVQFGLTTFKEREEFITDGPNDGGIDGYFIDTENKKIYVIQSKFRTNIKNFEEKNIEYEELLCMDINRIRQGKDGGEDGTTYNGKIKGLQRKLTETMNLAMYEYVVVILANISSKVKDSSLKKLTGGFDNILKFNYNKVYSDLVFPIVNGTYFNADELKLDINLTNINSGNSNINYSLKIENEPIRVRVFYVPTEEIAKILYKYKNSILEYNPRSYLDMKSGHINNDIYNSIVKSNNNEFSLYNNGITLLANDVRYTDSSGKEDIGVIEIVNPQILNGGQTSYTLSLIYEKILKGELNEKVFKGKDVLLKVIKVNNFLDNLHIIEKISRATNNQSFVKDSDRKSNDDIQLKLQKEIFEKYSLFYERKVGEFGDGIKEEYIHRNSLLKRELFLKMSLCAQFPNTKIGDSDIEYKNPKNTTETWLFSDEIFDNILKYDGFDLNKSMYNCFTFLEIKNFKKEQRKDKKDKDGFQKYGNALRYGEIALIMVNGNLNYKEDFEIKNIKQDILKILGDWKKFDIFVKTKNTNIKYFDDGTGENNYYQYYKSNNLVKDLKEFFIKE